MNDDPSRSHRRVVLQAVVLAVVMIASGLETLALSAGVESARDLLLGLVTIAMVAAVARGS